MDYSCPHCQKPLRPKVGWPKEVDGREVGLCEFCCGKLLVKRAWGYRLAAKMLLMFAFLPFLQVLLADQWSVEAWLIVGAIIFVSGLIWCHIAARYRDYRVYEKDERSGSRG